MRKRQKTKGQILARTALKVTPLFLVVVIGGKIIYDTLDHDYGGVVDLHDLNNEVVLSQQSSGDYNPQVVIPTDDGKQVVFDDDNMIDAEVDESDDEELIVEDVDLDALEAEEAAEEDINVEDLIPVEEEVEEDELEPEETVISSEMLDSGYQFAQIDWQALQSYNEDVRSYIIIDGTHISYPVVQSADNVEYMTTGFKGEEERCGTPFIDYRTPWSDNTGELRDVTVVYGHHMSGGLMFSDITQYQHQDFYNQHPFFIMYTADGQAYRIDVAAVNIMSGEDDTALHAWDFASELDFKKYNSRILRDSLIQSSTRLQFGDKVMCLVTCTYDHGSNKRCVVIGRATKVLVNRDLLEQSKGNYKVIK